MEKKELIIQKCYAISGFAEMRGRATLKMDQKVYDTADRRIDIMIEELQKIFVEKDETKGT